MSHVEKSARTFEKCFFILIKTEKKRKSYGHCHVSV